MYANYSSNSQCSNQFTFGMSVETENIMLRNVNHSIREVLKVELMKWNREWNGKCWTKLEIEKNKQFNDGILC